MGYHIEMAETKWLVGVEGSITLLEFEQVLVNRLKKMYHRKSLSNTKIYLMLSIRPRF